MDQVIQALRTSGGMLWKALWALIFGYAISGVIQVLVTREQMARALGDRGAREGALAGFFGFVSSSCSFAALAVSRAVLMMLAIYKPRGLTRWPGRGVMAGTQLARRHPRRNGDDDPSESLRRLQGTELGHRSDHGSRRGGRAGNLRLDGS